MRIIPEHTHNLNLKLRAVVEEMTDGDGDPLYALAGELQDLLPPDQRRQIDRLMDGVVHWRDRSIMAALKVATMVHSEYDPPEPVLRPDRTAH